MPMLRRRPSSTACHHVEMKLPPSLFTFLLGTRYEREHRVHILRKVGVERYRNPQLPRAPIKLALGRDPEKESPSRVKL